MKKYLLIIFVFLIAYNVGAQSPQQSPAPTQTTAVQQQQVNYCDPNYVGETMNFSMTTQLPLDVLIEQIYRRFGVNFIMGEGIRDLPINIRSGSLPWNTLLNSQLFLSGVRARCIGNNTIELVKNEELPKLQDAADVQTKFIKLKFLQPTTGGTQNLAGRSTQNSSQQGCGGQGGGQTGGQTGGGSQGCGNFEKLLIEIEKILGIRSPTSSGGQGGGNTQTTEAVRTNRSVSVIPGRNILVIRATDEEIELINEIIAMADRPPFQVIIRGLVYTANVDRLRDLGAIRTSVAIGNPTTTTGGEGSLSTLTGLFDFSALIGTVEFNIQAAALQRDGVISVKSRPFSVVLDGDPAALEVGRQIPVLTQGSVNGGDAGTLEFISASNLLSVTPHVIDDENGNPVAVNLELQLESNEVDTAIVSQGVPAVNRRSIQSRIILTQDKTVVLGGFTIDGVTDSVSKTPGLGDIPLLGYLFKRKVRTDQVSRLYFALSVSVVPYGQVLEPVKVPGATTEIPSVIPEVKKKEGNLEKRNQ